MPTVELQEKLTTLPTKPGCYLYKDKAGQIIYVGKAINLRNRVRSYFQKSTSLPPKVRRLVENIHDMDFIVVESELEALVLECNLIKKYQPHYNVRLRDDRHYPFLCLTTSEPYPRLLLTRRIKQDNNRYFGPYSNTKSVYATMELVNKIFPLVSCGKAFDGRNVQKTCLYFHLNQCLGPCAGKADPIEYKQAVRDVVNFLEGKQEQVLKNLRKQMAKASEELHFERAARLRDQVQAVEDIMSRQKVISSRMTDQDVVAIVGDEGNACVQMFFIRGGKLIGQNHFLLEGAGEGESTSEAVQEFVKQYYQGSGYVPQELILPCSIEETAIVQQWLRQKRGSKVEITVPVRGDKKRLVEMAAENAAHAMQQIKAEMRAKLNSSSKALGDLADALKLEKPPTRIECFDISNFQSDHFVGSMVVCENGEMLKSDYRRFKIKFHENKPDDYAMMREVLTRRLYEGKAGNPRFHKLPDLIIVDGGKGQVTSAMTAMEETGITVPLCGLAKKFELLVLPNEPDPVALPRTSQALYLVQRIRDEAHRFANAYRISVQSRAQTKSVLDNIPGIGPKRRSALLKHFGSVERLSSATVEEMSSAPNMTKVAAATVSAYFRQLDNKD